MLERLITGKLILMFVEEGYGVSIGFFCYSKLVRLGSDRLFHG